MELAKLYPKWVVSVRNQVHSVVDLQVVVHLRGSLLYQARLVDLFGVDLSSRVILNYLFWGFHQLYWFQVTAPVESITFAYPAAGWFEREAFEMFGLSFPGNFDLRRLLTDYGFKGYPLLKDFPVTGYYSCYYSERHKRVFQTEVDYSQEFRVNFQSLKFAD